MRPIKLSVQGFTSFRARQEIDFTELDLFAITGPTGAGKSSLLDAMTYALYGQVARVSKSQTEQLVSQGAHDLKVQLEFEVGQCRYRATRTWHYRKSSPKKEFLLDQQVSSEWVRQDGEVEDLLKMNFETFTRVILLPQGAFDQFLKGKKSDRHKILRELAGLQIFDDMKVVAGQRKASFQGQLETLAGQLAGLELATEAQVQAQSEQLAHVEAQLPQLEQQLQRLNRDLKDAETLSNQIQKLATVQATLAQLHSQREEINALKLRLDQAQVADRLQPAWQAFDQAYERQGEAQHKYQAVQQRQASAQAEFEQQSKAYNQLESDRPRVEADLATLQDRLTKIEQRQEQLTAQQKTFAMTEAKQQKVQADWDMAQVKQRQVQNQVEETQQAIAQLQTQQRAIACDPERLDRLTPVIPLLKPWQSDQDRVIQAEQALQNLRRDQTDCAQQKDRAQTAASAAAQRRVEAEDQQNAAQQQLDHAIQADHASAIQAHLHTGESCPVCGGVVPEVLPSLSAGNTVKALKAALAKVQKDFNVAQKADDAARETLTQFKTQLSSFEEQIKTADQQHQALAEQYRQATAEIATHLRTDTWEKAALEQEHKKLQAAQRQVDDLQDQLNSLNHELEKQQQQASFASETVERSTAELATATAETEAEQAKLTDQQTQLEALLQGQTLKMLQGQLRRQRKAWEERVKTVNAAYQESKAAVDKAETLLEERSQTLTTANEQKITAESTWQTALGQAEFTAEQFQAAQASPKQQQDWQAQLKNYADQLTQNQSEERALQQVIGDRTLDPQTLEQHRQEQSQIQQQLTTAQSQRDQLKQWLDEQRRTQNQAQQLQTDLTAAQHQAEIYKTLAQDLQSNNFQAFLLESWEHELVARATVLLQELSQDRYRLSFTPKGDYQVHDRWNADETRSVRTLSGGETFAASLSMALALSEKLSLGVELGSLFLDEGFGTLDQESLESVYQILESLRQRDRLIGVITHIDALAERLPTRLVIEKRETGSTVKVEA
ncbi:MAG: SMC family ATPase [Spirulina sp. SIO3F2]|nr:SMC family ATPase [Spirulina sp. SIO3F2]